MAIRNNKRVTFVEQDLTQDQVIEIQKENFLLRGKLFEMEQFCEKAEKCFNQSVQKAQIIEELNQKNKDLMLVEAENKERIFKLENENRRFFEENQKLKQDNSELLLKKQILEGEIERLSESVHNYEMQIKKAKLGKVGSVANPIYGQTKLQSGALKIPDEQNLGRFTVDGSSRMREHRTKLADSHITRMKSLAGLNSSTKNLNSSHFNFSSPDASPKHMQQTSNVEELKKLIRQAKENHLKLKSTF